MSKTFLGVVYNEHIDRGDRYECQVRRRYKEETLGAYTNVRVSRKAAPEESLQVQDFEVMLEPDRPEHYIRLLHCMFVTLDWSPYV